MLHTPWFHLYDILQKVKPQRQRTHQWLPRAEVRGQWDASRAACWNLGGATGGGHGTVVVTMQLYVLLETRRIVYSKAWILLYVTYISVNLIGLQKKTSAQVVLLVLPNPLRGKMIRGSHRYPGPNAWNTWILPFHGKRDFVDEIQLVIFFISLYLFIWLGHVGSSSLTRNWTWAPCVGSMES